MTFCDYIKTFSNAIAVVRRCVALIRFLGGNLALFSNITIYCRKTVTHYCCEVSI